MLKLGAQHSAACMDIVKIEYVIWREAESDSN